MADFLLSVGVDVGLSYDQMQKDISNLVSQLNSNPPKIKVGLDIDNTSIESFRNQVAEISKSLNGLGTVSINSDGSVSDVNEKLKERIALEKESARASSESAASKKASDDSYKKSEEQKQALLKKSYTLLTQMQNAQDKWTAAKNGKSATSYTAIQKDITSLDKLIAKYNDGDITAEKFSAELKVLSANFAHNSNVIKGAGENTKTWGERLGSLSAKFGTWFSITRVIMAAYRAVKQMVTNVIELDTAMTELKKVTNETDDTYEKFLVNATHRARELGAALTDTVNATASFARLGFGIEDAEKLADAAIVYKNVGDGIDDIDAASESIIATMQAFGVEAEDVMSIVDKFNEVGNNYAISSKGVGDALLRSAAAMHAANNSLDETIALATAANTVVQDPDKVGTTLKTVSMYLRAAKTEAEEAGESTEGMATSVSELRDELMSLTKNKVDIQLDDGTFKSTYQILKELSGVWDELSDITQANILEMVGGKRNSNVVAALLDNFSVAENALETSANSAGSALEENEKVLDSIQGKINILKATFETLSMNVFDSALIKGVVDFLTLILEFINGVAKVIGALGGLKTVLLTVASVLAIAKAEWIAHMIAMLKNAIVSGVTNGFSAVVSAIKNIINIIPVAITAWKGYAAGTVTASAAMQASIPVIGLVLAAITALTGAMALCSDSTAESSDTMQSEMDETNQKMKSLADTAATQSEEIVNLSLSYIKASEALESLTGSVDDYTSARDGLLKGLDIEQTELQKLIDKYGEYDKAIVQASISKLKEQEIDLRGGVTAAGNILDDASSSDMIGNYGAYHGIKTEGNAEIEQEILDAYEALKDMPEELQLVFNKTNILLEAESDEIAEGYYIFAGEASQAMVDAYGYHTAKILHQYQVYKESLKVLSDTVGTDNILYKEMYENYTEIQEAAGGLISATDALNENLAAQQILEASLNGQLPKTEAEFDAFRKQIVDSAKASGQFVGSVEDIERAIDNVLNDQPEFSDFYTPDTITGVASMVEHIDKLSDSLATVANLQKEVADGFTMSLDKALEFASVYPEILKGASATADGQITLNRDVVNSFIQAKKAELDAELDAKILELEADKAVLEAKRAAAEVELELAKQVGEGEGQISAEVAAYRVNCGNIMTQALIDQGIDEATAFQLAAAAMAGNVDEFNRIAAEVCTDVDGNFNEAAYSAAQAIYTNMWAGKQSVASFAQQCHEAAKAMAGVASGEVKGSSDVQGGGAGGTTGDGITITLHDGKFEGSNYKYEAKDFTLDEYISMLELDISNYTDKIAEIDGQIAILQAMKNKPITGFATDSNKSSKKDKEVEEYIADIDQYTEAIQKLREAELKQAKLERDLDNADTAFEKVGIQKELIEAYKERQQALHELNNLRDTTINSAIPELEALGFQIEYNADTNRLYIANLEHLNELQAESAGEYKTVQEATNALRKDTEKLIDNITGLNEENQESSETWLDLSDSINEGKESIIEFLNDAVTEAIDFVGAMQDVYDTLKDAAGEYAETGALSVDTLKAIAEYGAEYMNYLKDENGMLSINKERIEAVISARTKQLAVDTAMSYVEKLRYALSENNIKELNRLITATEQASDATWGLVYSNLALLDLDDSQYAQALENINRLRSLANNAVESIKLGTDESNKGYEDMQDALDKILDLTMELVEYEVNQEIEALEKQKDKYREIIDLKKEALDETKKENDYNKEVAKKVAEIAKLQDKINKLSLDDSREAQAEKAALEQELAELQTNLSDYQTDYGVDKQQEMLDEMADSYEEEKDKEIAILEDSISSTEKIYQLAIDRINDDWDNLYDDIIDWNYEAGSSIESEIVAAWELASKAVQEYGSYIEATNKLAAGATSDSVDLGASGNYGDPRAIINQMRNNSLQWFTASDAEQSRLSSANKTLASQLSSIYEQDVTSKDGAWYLDGETDPLYSIGKWEAVDFITKAMKNNSAKWSGASPSERAELEKANEKMAKYIADLSGQKVWKDSDGVWWIDNAKLYESYGTYHTGGVVGDSTLKKDEVMAILKDGELVLDEKREEGLYKLVDFAQILSERLGTTIDTSKFDNLFGGFSLLPTSRDLLPAAHAGSTLTEFSPHIEVNISHNGSMSDDDARRYGGLIAETALGELKDAFTKKGITNIGSSALK